MKRFVHLTALVVTFSFLVSCQKSPNQLLQTPEDKQKANEEQGVLLPNELLEREGLRFKINYPPGTAQIGLKLFSASPNRSEIPIGVTEEFMNYYIKASELTNNSDYILTLEYKTVSQDGWFDLEIIGFTSINQSKEFTLSNNSYAKSNAGTTKDFLRIRKGVTKFSFYKL